ncbi:C-type lectin domain family 2 member D-like [Thamnophis elegans]|uniref:C-type lectin domain family 2 member D-like n=1 Tax=Thamnophis elegans TaxID=35005 RepID=UPI001378EF16|nr:C-type lectin domain family 2 member D-like [Thamnophis elegans]
MAGGNRVEQAHPSNGYDRPSKGYSCVEIEETEMQNINEEQKQQHTSPNGNAGGHEEKPASSKYKMAVIGILIFIVILLIIILILVSHIMKNQNMQAVQTGTPVPLNYQKDAIKYLSLTCPLDWFAHQGYCYKVSEEEKNWFESQKSCNLQNSSLAKITEEEMHTIKMLAIEHGFWIGLRREPNQPWKWVDGENAKMEIVGNGGDCAFLARDLIAMSVRCITKHYYICKKNTPKTGSQPS